MPMRESEFALLRDPRLAVHATSATPAWLWSADASRLLWTNAVGAAVFGASTAASAAALRFDAGNPAAAQIARLSANLPHGGQTRLERLRGFGAGFARMLICACSRIALADKTPAVLVVATEPAGPSLTLAERVKRLFAGDDQPLAAFDADGTLLYAIASAQARLAGATTLSALGIETLAADALASGHAASGAFTIDRLGSQATTVLVVSFPAQRSEAAQTQPVAAVGRNCPDHCPAAGRGTSRLPSRKRRRRCFTGSRNGSAAGAAKRRAPNAPKPASERRHPLRFVWQMDADGRFVIGSDEFIELMGPSTTAAFGRSWKEIAAALDLDPEGQVDRALATRETWSGVIVSWPVDGTHEKLPVELSGLPVFDRDRKFRGYRGFGVCRDLDRINELARTRRTRPLGFVAAPATAPSDEMAGIDVANDRGPSPGGRTPRYGAAS